MIKKETVIDILRRIDVLLGHDAQFEAREYIETEVENLKGITPIKCKKKQKKYKFYNCNECRNINCPDNRQNLSNDERINKESVK
ncbi:MAG: hypothetical protein ACI4U9_03905 [Clostridia bacterium]